jgi:hypothetical protein
MGREEHLASRQPRSGVGDEVAYQPSLVVKVKVFHVADVAVRGAEFLSVEQLDILEHR